MHGLISERFLKRFAGGILRRQKPAPPQPGAPEDVHGAETVAGKDSRVAGAPAGKEDARPAERA